jgi:hypothetical protein
MELEIIMLSEINQACSYSFVEPRPKMTMTRIIMGHECERGRVWGRTVSLRGERAKKEY